MKDDKTFLYIFATTAAAVLAYFELDWTILVLLCITFLLDLASGILKSYVLGEYTSEKGWIGITAKALGLVLVLTFCMLLKILGAQHKYIMVIFLTGLAIHDLISASGNLYTIRTKKTLPEMDVFSMVIKSIHTYLRKIIQRLFNHDKKVH